MHDGALRIGVASSTRFHMFDLAQQIAALGQNTTLFTAYPRWKLEPELRRNACTRSRWLLAIALCRRLRISHANANNRLFRDFSSWLGRVVQRSDLDVLDVLDGLGLYAGRTIKDRGKVWLCNRGSSHILTQQAILKREHARWNAQLPSEYFVPERVQQCLTEYEECSGIVVPSSFAKRTFVDKGIPDDKVHVSPYGVDLSLFRRQAKEDDVFRVLFVGTISIQKGIGYLLDAVLPLVGNRHISVWCVGAIDETARHIIDRRADSFVYKGMQPRKSLSWFYSQASVLVLPSVQEGLALVQAQAMACGVPVIATPNTGSEDLFTDGVEGCIVPAQSSEAIREKILWLLDNPLHRDAMGEAALRRVTQLGGWRQYGERCLALYRKLLAPGVSHTADVCPS